MPSPEIDNFTNRVVKHIKFAHDRGAVRQELTEHIEDMIDDYTDDGMSKTEAVSVAIFNMGDADELGRELDKAHNFALGVLWLTAKIIAVIAVIIMVFSLIVNGAYAFHNIFGGYDDSHAETANVVYSVEVGEKFILDDMGLVLDKVIYYDDGQLEVRYRTWKKLFSNSIDWSFDLSSDCFYDESGNRIFSSGGYSGGGPITRHQTYLGDFPADAETLIVDYDHYGRKIYCEIPLGEGAVYETDK